MYAQHRFVHHCLIITSIRVHYKYSETYVQKGYECYVGFKLIQIIFCANIRKDQFLFI